MTIKNMVEFAQAEADGAEFEVKRHNDWREFEIGILPWFFIKQLIAKGALRIKPKTVTLYEYRSEVERGNEVVICVWSEEQLRELHLDALVMTPTGRSIQKAPIVEGE